MKHPSRSARSFPLSLVLLAVVFCHGTVAADDCTPEEDLSSRTAATLPAEFPSGIPLPENYFLMSAAFTPADEWNPYPNATIEFLVDRTRDDMFGFYEKNLPAAGYRIVMWEKDEGANGFRIRGEEIDQASIVLSEYDCRAYIMLNVSLLP